MKETKNINIEVDKGFGDEFLIASKRQGMSMKEGIKLAMLNQRLKWDGKEAVEGRMGDAAERILLRGVRADG